VTAPLITAEGVGFSVRRTEILRAVTLSVMPGRLTVVIGPNGAGKSTLLKLLVGELVPTRGRVLYGGEPLPGLPAWRLAAKRAVLPQSGNLAFPFTVHEVVALGLAGLGAASGGRAEAIVAEALVAADIAHLAERQVPTLSGGEQQRVHFARVLCQLRAASGRETRQALFLDEPIAGLDLAHQLAVLETACRLARDGVGVFAILHDLNLAAAYADELVVVRGGQVVSQGAPETVLTDALVREVFGVDLPVRAVPPPPMPFVLPQAVRGERGARASV
jgi:iron complex transport system ATP-binding protein